MPGNGRGSLPGPGRSRARAQLAGYLGACPRPAHQPSHPQSRGEGTETKAGAEKRLERGSCTCSPLSDLMRVRQTVKLPPPPLPRQPPSLLVLPPPASSHHSLFQARGLITEQGWPRYSHRPAGRRGSRQGRCSKLALDSGRTLCVPFLPPARDVEPRYEVCPSPRAPPGVCPGTGRTSARRLVGLSHYPVSAGGHAPRRLSDSYRWPALPPEGAGLSCGALEPPEGLRGQRLAPRSKQAQGPGSGVPGGVPCLLPGVTQLRLGSREAGRWGIAPQPSE